MNPYVSDIVVAPHLPHAPSEWHPPFTRHATFPISRSLVKSQAESLLNSAMPLLRFMQNNVLQLVARRSLYIGLVTAVSGCQGPEGSSSAERATAAAGPSEANGTVWVETIATLDDLDQPILGRPGRVTVDRLGRFVIADYSDRSIKIYSTDGRRVDTFGRAGQGPGEFTYLMDIGVVGERIFGYDYAFNSLSYFEEDGDLSETVSLVRSGIQQPQPYSITALDEDRFLFATTPQKDVSLLRIATFDGATVREFLPLDAQWTEPSTLWEGIFLPDHIWHQADAFGGFIFSALWGDNTIHVFTSKGTTLGRALVDAKEPLVSLPQLLRQNDGRIVDMKGVSIQNGNQVIRRVVASMDTSVTVGIAPFNTVTGADPLDSATLIVLSWRDGSLREVGRVPSSGWGLLGRDANGRPLVMRYAQQDRYDLGRVIWSESPAR